MPYFSAYSASKAALIRFTETTAEELRPLGIRINIIAPGPVPTQMLETVRAAAARWLPPPSPSQPRPCAPAGVSPGLAAQLCLFLASPAAQALSGKYLSAVWDDCRNWTPDQIADIAAANRLTLRRNP